MNLADGERPDPADPPQPLDAAWLRQPCLDCGADDAGLVVIMSTRRNVIHPNHQDRSKA